MAYVKFEVPTTRPHLWLYCISLKQQATCAFADIYEHLPYFWTGMNRVSVRLDNELEPTRQRAIGKCICIFIVAQYLDVHNTIPLPRLSSYQVGFSYFLHTIYNVHATFLCLHPKALKLVGQSHSTHLSKNVSHSKITKLRHNQKTYFVTWHTFSRIYNYKGFTTLTNGTEGSDNDFNLQSFLN